MQVASHAGRRSVRARDLEAIMALHRARFAAANIRADAAIWAVIPIMSRRGFLDRTESTRLAAA
jgi:hypothetical protein